MGIGLLPWEKWLPPYIFGPVLCLGSIYLLATSHDLAWWRYALLSGAAVLGVWSTYAWFKHGRNIFKEDKASYRKNDESN